MFKLEVKPMIHLQSVGVRYNLKCAARPTIYFYQSFYKKSVQDKASEDRFYFVRICNSSTFKILKVPIKTTAIIVHVLLLSTD